MDVDPTYELPEDLQAFVEERLGDPFKDSDTPDEEEESEEPEVEEEEGSEAEEESAPTPDEPQPTTESIYEIAPGVAISRDRALSYYEFDNLLKQRPDVAQEITRLVNTPPKEVGASEGPPPTSFELPEEYRDDPAFQQIHSAYTKQQEYLKSLEDRVKQLTDVTQTREQEELTTLIESQKASFQKSHSLSTEEMQKVVGIAERLNIVPSLLRGINPMTGEQEPRDRATALNRAFEIAYWYLPETREKEVTRTLKEKAKSSQRKQRLAGVSGGGGGSMSRQNQDVRKMSEQDRRTAMIKEIAEGMGLSQED